MPDTPTETDAPPTITTYHLTTPGLALPYPESTDPADVPADIHALTTRIEALYGANNGFATLDSSGHVPAGQLAATTLPVSELAFQNFNSPVTLTSTNPASQTVIVTAPTITLDGSTGVRVDFFAPALGGANMACSIALYDAVGGGSATSLGYLIVTQQANANADTTSAYGTTILVPAAGNHSFSIRGYTRGTVPAVVYAGAGGSDYMMGFISIRKR